MCPLPFAACASACDMQEEPGQEVRANGVAESKISEVENSVN